MLKMERIEVPGLAHYSYVLWSGTQAAVVDPKRDFDTYVEFASARQLKVTHILETHIHADYASGAKELAQATGLPDHTAGNCSKYRDLPLNGKTPVVTTWPLAISYLAMQCGYTRIQVLCWLDNASAG